MVHSVLAWLGPVSSARPGGTPFLYILGTLFACSIVWHAFRERARTKAIREFCARRDLTYVGEALPKSFPFNKATAFQWGGSVQRAFVGSIGSRDLVMFDCTIGYGRGFRPRTIVAARGQSGGSAGLDLDRILLLKKSVSGAWSIARTGLCPSRRSKLWFQCSTLACSLPTESTQRNCRDSTREP